jgi:hypothetical protein
MVALRLTCALFVGCFATSAMAEGRSARFNVSVQVVAPLRSPTVGSLPPPSFVGSTGSIALPCGAGSSAACSAAVAAAGSATGAPVRVTVLTDGAPTAIVER